MTAVDVARQRRPRHGVPLFNPRWRHTFQPPAVAMVPSQCVHCWGWYDDVRHK